MMYGVSFFLAFICLGCALVFSDFPLARRESCVVTDTNVVSGVVMKLVNSVNQVVCTSDTTEEKTFPPAIGSLSTCAIVFSSRCFGGQELQHMTDMTIGMVAVGLSLLCCGFCAMAAAAYDERHRADSAYQELELDTIQ